MKKSQCLGGTVAEAACELEPDQRSDHASGEAEGERGDHLVIDVRAPETYRVSDSRIKLAWTRFSFDPEAVGSDRGDRRDVSTSATAGPGSDRASTAGASVRRPP